MNAPAFFTLMANYGRSTQLERTMAQRNYLQSLIPLSIVVSTGCTNGLVGDWALTEFRYYDTEVKVGRLGPYDQSAVTGDIRVAGPTLQMVHRQRWLWREYDGETYTYSGKASREGEGLYTAGLSRVERPDDDLELSCTLDGDDLSCVATANRPGALNCCPTFELILERVE
jgi:hypothetical protein